MIIKNKLFHFVHDNMARAKTSDAESFNMAAKIPNHASIQTLYKLSDIDGIIVARGSGVERSFCSSGSTYQNHHTISAALS
mgnify:FL=1